MKYTLHLTMLDNAESARKSFLYPSRTGNPVFIDIDAPTIEVAKALAVGEIANRITQDINFTEAKLFCGVEDVKHLIEQGNTVFMDRWHAQRKEDMRKQLAYLKKELGEE